jgi:methyltransferase OMS1
VGARTSRRVQGKPTRTPRSLDQGVCKSEGKILLLEQVQSDREWLARFQDRTADRLAKQLGCHWNREPLELLQKGNLRVKEAQRFFLGVFHQIEAEPGAT